MFDTPDMRAEPCHGLSQGAAAAADIRQRQRLQRVRSVWIGSEGAAKELANEANAGRKAESRSGQRKPHNLSGCRKVSVGACSFDTLVAAVQAANLVDTLKSDGRAGNLLIAQSTASMRVLETASRPTTAGPW